MFYLRYIAAELRRRRGRTVITALGLGVAIGSSAAGKIVDVWGAGGGAGPSAAR